MPDCELCQLAEVVLENDLAYARPDSHALSRGHMLVVPKRHVADFFAMTAAEQGAVGLNVAAKLLAWPALLRKAYRLDPSFAT